MPELTEDEIEEASEGAAFRDALLNGDEKFNRFVRLVDRRFESQARRTNKGNKASRDAIAGLRDDLAPVIDFVQTIKALAPLGGILGGLLTIGGIAYSMGLIP